MIGTIAQYRLMTRDYDTPDYQVTEALNNALADAEDFCERKFEQAQRTEVLRIYGNGRVYPSAWPIAAVSLPNARIDGNSVVVYTSVMAAPIDYFALWNDQHWRPTISVTYTAGYASGTAPQQLVRAIIQLAYENLHPSLLPGVPVGATSVHVGDISITGGSTSLSSISPTVKRALSPFKRRRVIE